MKQDKVFKPSLFYRISICLIIVLVLIVICVKAIIWNDAVETYSTLPTTPQFQITLLKGMLFSGNRYTNELKQGLFNRVAGLLAPAGLLIFVLIAVKLMMIRDLFEEQEEKNVQADV